MRGSPPSSDSARSLRSGRDVDRCAVAFAPHHDAVDVLSLPSPVFVPDNETIADDVGDHAFKDDRGSAHGESYESHLDLRTVSCSAAFPPPTPPATAPTTKAKVQYFPHHAPPRSSSPAFYADTTIERRQLHRDCFPSTTSPPQHSLILVADQVASLSDHLYVERSSSGSGRNSSPWGLVR